MKVTCRYYNPLLKLALNDWREVYLLANPPGLLKTETHRSSLVYRFPKTGKRISYKKVKQGLIRQGVVLQLQVLPLKLKTIWL
jgi:hypothetical protein